MFRFHLDFDVDRRQLTDQVDEDVGQVDILNRVVGVAGDALGAVITESGTRRTKKQKNLDLSSQFGGSSRLKKNSLSQKLSLPNK